MEASTSQVGPSRRFWPAATGLVGVSVLLGLWCLGDQPLGDHESFVGTTAREMLQRGDWIVPTWNGQIRLQKTPLNYWLVALAAGRDRIVDEWATRLPSALCGVVSAAAIVLVADRWMGRRAAILAGIVWITSMGFLRYTHNGRPEMSVTAFITLAMTAFYAGCTAHRRRTQVVAFVVFWLAFGVAMLAKGPLPTPMVGLPIAIWIAYTRRWDILRRALPIAGMVLFLAIALPWPILLILRLRAQHADSWAGVLGFWKGQFVDRFLVSRAGGGKPWWYYGYVMFLFAAPWAVLLPIGLLSPFYRVWGSKESPRRSAMIFLWIWFAADVVFLSLSKGKRQHYILPAMPAAAMLIGMVLEDMVFERRAFTTAFVRKMAVVHGVVVLAMALGVAAMPFVWTRLQTVISSAKDIPAPSVAWAGGVAAGLLVMAVASAGCFVRGRSTAGATTIVTGLVVVILLVGQYVSEASRAAAIEPRSARRLAQIVGPSDPVTWYGRLPECMVFYFGRPLKETQDIEQVRTVYEQGGWVVVRNRENIQHIEQATSWRRTSIIEDAVWGAGPEPIALYHRPIAETSARLPGP